MHTGNTVPDRENVARLREVILFDAASSLFE
jgi:hypothetical protein